MTHEAKRIYLIKWLLNENDEYRGTEIPDDEYNQKRLLRGLMNVRMPGDAAPEFLKIQDEYLQEALAERGVVDVAELPEIEPGICLWQGDITRLNADAIANAANNMLRGCFRSNHGCIDNCIHTFAGMQLRKKCDDLMNAHGPGYEEPTGIAEITPAYNLPCKYVLHTVGPIVQGELTKEHEKLLASCYTSCLNLSAENGLESVAFCCISTGVFMFPNDRAAEIAVDTVREYLKKDISVKKVIFNVFKDYDKEIYENLLGI